MPDGSSRRNRGLAARRDLFSAAFFLLLLLPSCTDAGRDALPLRIGYMICNSLEETQSRFGPLTAYLGEQLGREVRPVYLDTVDFEEAVRRKEFDIIHTNSLLYVWFRDEHGFRVLSGEQRGKHGSFSAGAIVVHADSGIRSLEDLKGKRFVFGPPLAPTAFLSQYFLLLEGGVDPETDLGYYAIPWGSFKHEKAVYGVWFGKYDAGAAPLLDLELMAKEKKIPTDDLRVIAEGPLVPYCVFSAPPSLPEETFQKVQSVLFDIDSDSVAAVEGEAIKVLKSAGVDGFEALEESDFHELPKMARRAKLPPYAEY
jgi:phosphonate transport system substrate-binding protein